MISIRITYEQKEQKNSSIDQIEKTRNVQTRVGCIGRPAHFPWILIQDLESGVSVGETKVTSVEGQADIVIKQMSPGKGTEIIEQQVLHIKAGEFNSKQDVLLYE